MKETYSEMTPLGLKLHSVLLKAICSAARDYEKKQNNWNKYIQKISEEEMELIDNAAAEKSYSEFAENIELKFALDSLPNELKTIIEMYYIDGLTNIEIAKLKKVSEVTIIKRKTEALNIMRERRNCT